MNDTPPVSPADRSPKSRIDTIFAALGRVTPSHLLDRALHDFAAVRAATGDGASPEA